MVHCDGAPLAPAARAAVVCQPSCACTRPPSASDGPPSRSLHRSQPFIMTKKRRSGCARRSCSRRLALTVATVHDLAVMALLLCACMSKPLHARRRSLGHYAPPCWPQWPQQASRSARPRQARFLREQWRTGPQGQGCACRMLTGPLYSDARCRSFAEAACAYAGRCTHHLQQSHLTASVCKLADPVSSPVMQRSSASLCVTSWTPPPSAIFRIPRRWTVRFALSINSNHSHSRRSRLKQQCWCKSRYHRGCAMSTSRQ